LLDVAPDGGLQLLGLDGTPRAAALAVADDAVLAVALVVAVLGLTLRRVVGDAEHGQATRPTGEQAAEQVVVARVVAERERRITPQLLQRLLVRRFVDDGGDWDADPLLARARATAGVLVGARPPRAGPPRRHEGVAVGVGGAGVERVGEDAMHNGAGPQATAAARPPGAGGEPLEDLSDRHSLIDQPAVQLAHHLGLGVIDDQVRGYAVPPGNVAIAVGRLAADPLPGARLLKLAAAEALAEEGALVLGDGALDLEQELVVGVVRDGVVDEEDLAGGLAQLLQQEHLVGVAAREAVRAVHGDDGEGAFPRGVAEAIQCGPIEARAGVALVGEDVLGPERVALRLHPLT
jgi:hypothetical protein